MDSTQTCWCGSTTFTNFSPEYMLCGKCGTLVVRNCPPEEHFDVTDDENNFYGRNYYESHVVRHNGLPTLEQRSRTDLNERCMHWMRTVLKYAKPPGRSLEIGSAHGGFVALMQKAGFDATGLEMSPWLVELSKKTFNVPVLEGMIEKQNLEPGTFDLVMHFDVLEHLPDPRRTMRSCMELLKPGGVMIIQTPCFPTGKTYEELSRANDKFLEMLMPLEHLNIFSKESVTQLLAELGAPFVHFEEPIFYQYDMYLVASRRELAPRSANEITEDLLSRSEGRMVQALLDANDKYTGLSRTHEITEADREARLVAINELKNRLDAEEKRPWWKKLRQSR